MNWWTIQTSQWRRLKDTGIMLIDTSIKAGSIWGPDWDFLMAYKRKELDEAGYIEAYLNKLENTIKTRNDEWLALLTNQEPVALGCFCNPDTFCHRHLLTHRCIEACKTLKIPFNYHGEYP